MGCWSAREVDFALWAVGWFGVFVREGNSINCVMYVEDWQSLEKLIMTDLGSCFLALPYAPRDEAVEGFGLYLNLNGLVAY
jgi:hypothetical protein